MQNTRHFNLLSHNPHNPQLPHNAHLKLATIIEPAAPVRPAVPKSVQTAIQRVRFASFRLHAWVSGTGPKQPLSQYTHRYRMILS
jgi:hypothetical protein